MGDFKSLIEYKLNEIEESRGIKILLASEVGSRTYGYNNEDSDYDVRFIYKRRPEDYLMLNPGRDTIELINDGNLDISGWDLDKTLKQIKKSNLQLYEWLGSPIIYRKEDRAIINLISLMNEYYNEAKGLYHYTHILKRNLKDSTNTKQLITSLRVYYCCRWIMLSHNPPPVVFEALMRVNDLPEEWVYEILELKRMGIKNKKLGYGSELVGILQSRLTEIEDLISKTPKVKEKGYEDLNSYFINEIMG